jgi:serine/threonine-protein kinase RsbW
MPGECHLITAGRPDQLCEISEFVVQAARRAGLNEKDVFYVQTAVDEACANIIEHAYEGQEGGHIRLNCCWTEDTFTVTIQDRGSPFDPEAVPPPNLSDNLDARGVGGLGLYFMRQMMDEVCFEFDDQAGNTLTMVKRIKP